MTGFRPIAIVGQACLLPGAHSPDELWTGVLARRDLLGRASAATWQVADQARLMRRGGAAPPAERIPSDRGGYVTGFERIFDPAGYGLEREVVTRLDPLFQWLLHVGREALRDAGIDPKRPLAGGAIVGNLSYPTYALNEYAWSVWAEHAFGAGRADARPDAWNRFMSGLPAQLLCDALQLTRGGFMVDAACASSLYAIKFACDRLNAGQADVMLAGGVARVHGLTIHAGFTTLQALSASGRSRPLHARADGLVPSEGAALVVLKRLEDAVADGSRILGVIRGLGLSNDGRGPGPLVPSAAGQVRAMHAAYRAAGLQPSEIDLIECHATGTQLGDATELESCANVFAEARRVALGSVKSNLGHLLPVAGVAGLIKVLKSMEHGALPALRELDEPTPALTGTPFAPCVETTAWESREPRRAAINAFGFGGNNAHLIVEQPKSTTRLSFSAPTEPPKPAERIAIVGMSVRRAAVPGGRIETVQLPLEGSAFPPADLEHALAQQLLALEVAHEAIAGLRRAPGSDAAIFVGMGGDPEACRFGLNLRLGEFLAEHGVAVADPIDVARARQAILPGPFAATTLGLMPNMVTNRLNRQFAAEAGSCSVSAEERSGLEALKLGIAALQAGETATALIGAVELGHDPVHAAARDAAGYAGASADGACLLVLKRESDARREGETILAWVDTQPPHDLREPARALAGGSNEVAHAAAGLLRLAEAALTVAPQKAVRVDEFWVTGGEAAAVERRMLQTGARARRTISFPAHRPAVAEILRALAVSREPMPRPPWLQPVAATPEGDPVSEPVALVDEAPESDSERDSVVALHELFLEQMTTAHLDFLARCGGAGVLPQETEFAGEGMAPNPVEVSEPEVAAEAVAEMAEATPVGPRFSREQLIELASGKISALFGPAFAGQDDFARQVRMPMPPMLLADRVTGIDAVPGELGVGTIWTETDVTADAWYLDVDRAPLGITIEAGQADLLLVSWMGIDRFNRSERIYRLLGCEATVLGPLPKVGDTLQFEIRIDGHASLGGIRMMFFRSDLGVNGEVRLSVRHGQAGFFTDEELADSEGVLWDAADVSAPALRGVHAAPRVRLARRAFDRAAVRAFAEGRVAECFGAELRRTRAHTRTPKIPSGRMQLIDEVTECDPAGGPWGRGYLRAVKSIAPDEWFFAGHFKNDPCMPGTLMLEGAVQALAFYLAGLGCTRDADGWRFEPVAREPIAMRCRGQCVPTSRELVYEVFVEEFTDGPQPRLRATVLASVDGLKAFLAQGLAIELVPDWPLEAMLRRGEIAVANRGTSWRFEGFAFDHRSLLACALGPPSEAFGPRFRALDSPIRIPRLPRPPYHFMSRIAGCTAAMAQPRVGVVAEAEFDYGPRDWFFLRNGAATMPSCVFMEALLQPCGWLSSFVRDTRGQANDIFFRNLDGTLTWHEALRPAEGVLRVRTELTNWSELGTMIIVGFRVRASADGRDLATMETSFGFFPGDAFANQAGLVPSELEARFATAPANLAHALPGADAKAFERNGAALAGEPLLMLDRLTGWWPEAGAAKVGVLRGEKDVRAGEWFFNAHFMQDPVQPGSLGIEAMLQLLQCAMRLRGLGADYAAPEFEPVALGEALTWKYRGQVTPENATILTLVELTEIALEVEGIVARGRASLWVDGKKIYEASRLAMRVRPGRSPARSVSAADGDVVFGLATHPWLDDHRPSFTTAVVPLTVLVDEIVQAAARTQPARRVVEVAGFFPTRWVTCRDDGTTRLQTRVTGNEAGDGCNVSLALWRDARREELSRFDAIGVATVAFADGFPTPPPPLPPLEAPMRESPYDSGETTHGPAFRVMRKMRRSADGGSCWMDAAGTTVPFGAINPALLDGCTHAVPFSRFGEWYPAIADHWNGLPRGVHRLRFFGETPTEGSVRCELRPRGLDPRSQLPLAYVQFIVGDRVWCDLEMEFALLDATPFQRASFAARHGFLRRGEFHREIRFSRDEAGAAVLSVAATRSAQWMPRQLETMFGLEETPDPAELAEAIAAREAVAHALEVHPARVQVKEGVATLAELPVQALPLAIAREAAEVRVRIGPPRLRTPVGATYFAGEFLSDLAEAVVGQHVRYLRSASPLQTEAVRGRPLIVCSNHQTALESLVFTDLFMRWSGCPLTTVTRIEHRDSWVGQLTDLLWRYPRQEVPVHPQMLFDRDRPESFLQLVAEFKAAQSLRPHAVHLHVEGEQALRSGQPVARMSAALIDLALAADLPILPVKFSGGLPCEGVTEVVSLPFALGRQDYVLGAPLFPEELRGMPRPKAAERVVAAINSLPPAAGEEQPLAGESDLAERMAALRAAHGVGEIQAALLVALERLASPTEITRAMLAYGRGDDRTLVAHADDRGWHVEFAEWLWRRDADAHTAAEAWKRTAKT